MRAAIPPGPSPASGRGLRRSGTTTEADLLHLSSYATNLGVGALGRCAETELLLRKCLAHPILGAESPVRRSLHRALGVTLILADRKDDAAAEMRQGVSSPTEECRFAGAVAQTLLARGRPIDALPYLRRAAALCPSVPADDDVLNQTAAISNNLLRVAEPQCQIALELVVTAAQTTTAAAARAGDWQVHHKALFQLGRAWLANGNPARALNTVQAMLQLEREHEAGPVPRFYSANLASRAQCMRGQLKIARAAWAACQDFASEAEQAGEPLGPQLEDLQQLVQATEADIGDTSRR